MIAVSIVSHGHGSMVASLARNVLSCEGVAELLVTRNIPEILSLPDDPRIRLIDNHRPKGFGANHNQAFKLSGQPFFCALNPDVSWVSNPFGQLVTILRHHPRAVVAPLVWSTDGRLEDSFRYFPTVRALLSKALSGERGRYPLGGGGDAVPVEWVAGMFMLFCRDDYARLGGFDESFFLYYEDVDICVRAWRDGLNVLVCPHVNVIHDARRQSRKSLQHMKWHLVSMARYFGKHWGRLPKVSVSAWRSP